MNTNIERFLKRKAVVRVLGANYVLKSTQLSRLTKLFNTYTLNDIGDRMRTIALFIKNDVCNYVGRIRRMKTMPASPNKLSYVLRYGPTEAKKKYKDTAVKRTKHFKNTTQYWLDLGYTLAQAEVEVLKIQKERNLLAVEVIKGSSEYTVRSTAYWVKKGYTLEQATEEVRRVQTSNGIEYYISTGLSLTDATNKQEERNDRWQTTLNDKPQEERDLIALKKSHTVDGYIACGYDEDTAKKKSIAYFKKRKNYSAVSQDYFDLIVEQFDLNNAKYATINYEYQIKNKCVDFYHPDTKTVVEFYGDFWHMNPNMYASTDKCYNRSAAEIWEDDQNRIQLISTSDEVDNIIIIWESEYRKNPQKCINKLKGYLLK